MEGVRYTELYICIMKNQIQSRIRFEINFNVNILQHPIYFISLSKYF